MAESGTFSSNEVIEMMNVNEASSFRALADFIEKFKMDWPDSVKFLRENADLAEAQAMVVRLRDNL